ncbi:MAG: hypothetical protein KDK50_04275 [Chlamydiia bacterium]|nr:hypothetical protein [Chlamydiia bacterium]
MSDTVKLNFSLKSDADLRAMHDTRWIFRKVVHLALSFFRQAKYTLAFSYRRFTEPSPLLKDHKCEWKSNTKALIVLIHGLRSDPVAWNSQLNLLKEQEQIDVFAPVVPNRGMCSLKSASNPIFKKLKDYANTNPGKPICIMGVSNGSRIATHLEVKLRKHAPATPVRVSTIAGVHLGSSRMGLVKALGLAKFFYPTELMDELSYKSKCSVTLLNRVKTQLPEACAKRSYEFFATTEDQSVPDLDSSLPSLNLKEKIWILHGHSHDSIVPAVANQQVKGCIDWIGSLTQ